MTERLYGDENTGYRLEARDMIPNQAGRYLQTNQNDCLIEGMPGDRLRALRKRASELEFAATPEDFPEFAATPEDFPKFQK